MAIDEELTRALDLAFSGDFTAAHAIVQQHPSDRTACWLHACLHRIEGDISNAAYWYRRAGRSCGAIESTAAELEAIRFEIDKSA